MKLKINWDILGAITSLACAIHCALLPILLTSLPVFGINIIHNEYFEWAMILIAFIVGAYSLLHGFTKHHNNHIPLLAFCGGIIFLVLKQLLPSFQYVLLFIAVCLILYAHYTNYKLCHKSKCNSPHHKH
jgi:Ca2+/Na+ antiporter